MNGFAGVTFTVVEPGTEVGKDAEGAPLVVSDAAVVFNGHCAWMTQKVYDKLKAKIDDKLKAEERE